MPQFQDRRVLVTGSSRNTGLGIAQAFAREGARVVINGTQPEHVAAAVAGVPGAVPAVADLSTLAGVEASFAVVDTELGGLDVLVNNAVHQGGGGVIVNIGSNTADRPVHARTAYCASKGAIDSVTRAMALDLAPHGIRVNCVAPGYIWTDRWETLDPAVAARRRANIPLGEPASAADVAAAVLFLASDEAANVTGSRLVVDGGVLSQLTPADVG